MESAFNKVIPENIMKRVRCLGVPDEVMEWYGYYLQNRDLTLALEGVEVKRSLIGGMPQGGILLPQAWNIVLHGLFLRLSCFCRVKPVCYTDEEMFFSVQPML